MKILPKRILNQLIKPLLNFQHKQRERVIAEIPKYQLTDKHIRNTRFLTDRNQLMDLLPRNGVVGELGVDMGHFSELIYQIALPKKLHLVDIWGSERFSQEKREKVKKKFDKQIRAETVEINVGLSTEVVHQFKEQYFDWIYIDTDHSYATTLMELESYRSKVKKGGIIAGHDFMMGNWVELNKYGVIEAVYEFCVKHDWELLYVTVNYKPSFAIREIESD